MNKPNSNGPSKKRIASIGLIVAVLCLALFLGLYFSRLIPDNNSVANSPTVVSPFDYSLIVVGTNAEVIQGNMLSINVTAGYLEGESKNVSLELSGLPQQSTYSFNPQKGVPTMGSPFNSTLQILVSEETPSDYYNLTIISKADSGKIHSSQYELSVLNSKIILSGTVITNNATPTQITFEQLSSTGSLTGKTYSSVINSGNYSVELPNNEFFAVRVAWTGPDGTTGTQHFIQPYRVNAGVGVNSINCPFEWDTA